MDATSGTTPPAEMLLELLTDAIERRGGDVQAILGLPVPSKPSKD